MGHRNAWNIITTAAWLLSVFSVAMAIWMIYQYGLGDQVGLGASGQLESQASVNMPVILGGAFQIAASVLFGCLFSMLNSIYKNTVDIWIQNQSALKRGPR